MNKQNRDEVLYVSSNDHLCLGQTGIAVSGVAVLKHASLNFVEVDLAVRASVFHEHVVLYIAEVSVCENPE